MRKIINLSMLMTVFIFITACNLGSETKTFVIGEDGAHFEVIITHENDLVISQTTRTETDYDVIGVSNEIDAEKKYNEVIEPLPEIKGLSVKTDFLKDTMTKEITIVFKELDFEELEKHPVFFINNPELIKSNNKEISVKDAVDYLKELGFSEK